MNPQIVLAKDAILKSVSDLESATDLPQLRKRISSLRNRVLKARISRLSHPGTHQVTISRQFLTNELDQIAHSQTLVVRVLRGVARDDASVRYVLLHALKGDVLIGRQCLPV